MAELDADRALALTYVPTAKRAAIQAIWRLDATLGQVLAGGREPLISQIKLTWWRDALEKLDSTNPPAEPVLQAVAAEVLPAGVSAVALSELEQGWTPLLSPDPLTEDELASYASARGAALFRLSAAILGPPLSWEMERSAEAWALVDLARHSNPVDAAAAYGSARERLHAESVRWPAALRPLGMLAALAERDLRRGLDHVEPQGAPRRMLRMLQHWVTGR